MNSQMFLHQISNMLEEKIQKIEGDMIEDNRFCISVHFRTVHEKVIELHFMKSSFTLQVFFLTIEL